MKKLLPIFAFLALSAGQAFADDTTVSFDFTSAEEINALGIETPANGAGTPITAALTKDGVTITADQGTASNPTRIWASNSGVLDLRAYNGSTLSISVPDGKLAKEITWTSGGSVAMTTEEGTLKSASWTGEANSVTFSVTGTSRFNVITITYGEASTPEEPYDGKTATFDYTSNEQITGWGVELPEAGNGVSLNEKTLTSGDATMSFSNGAATTDSRIFVANNGNINLRLYNGSVTTFGVAEGFAIDKIEFECANSNLPKTDNTWSTGTLSATEIWTPADGETVTSVELTAGVTLQINKVTFYYKANTVNAITEVKNESTADDAIYNLQGQRISRQQAHGLVIIGGKKMVIK